LYLLISKELVGFGVYLKKKIIIHSLKGIESRPHTGQGYGFISEELHGKMW
jgi:hypothetical protein